MGVGCMSSAAVGTSAAGGAVGTGCAGTAAQPASAEQTRVIAIIADNRLSGDRRSMKLFIQSSYVPRRPASHANTPRQPSNMTIFVISVTIANEG